MIGIPGSGKTEMANKLAAQYGAAVFSSDNIRKELTGNESDQTVNDKVFKTMFERTCATLNDGVSAIYDATNLSGAGFCLNSYLHIMTFKQLRSSWQRRLRCA